MTSLDNAQYVDPPVDGFDWQSDRVAWEDIPGDGTVSRTIIAVNDEVWSDKHAVYRDPMTFWQRMLQGKYGFDWQETFPERGVILTRDAGNTVHVRKPYIPECDQYDIAYVAALCREMDVSDDAVLQWDVDDERWQRVSLDRFYELTGQ